VWSGAEATAEQYGGGDHHAERGAQVDHRDEPGDRPGRLRAPECELPPEVLPGRLLPPIMSPAGRVQGGLAQTLQEGHPAAGEVPVADVRVLLADAGRVLVVPVGGQAEDAQVGVAQHRAVRVVRLAVVRGGQPDQAADLRDLGGVDPVGGQLELGQLGRDLLVLTGIGLRVVDRVVEPGGQADRVGVVGQIGEFVDGLEQLGQVPLIVIVAVLLCVTGQ
jgi:hypothetical protein